MKKLIFAFACSLILPFGNIDQTFAHDIPPEVLEFLLDNPNATDAEILEFTSKYEDIEGFGLDEHPDDVEKYPTFGTIMLEFLLENPDADYDQTVAFATGKNILKAEQAAIDFYFNRTADTPKTTKPAASTWDTIRSFFWIGCDHVWAGFDHLLFILSLGIGVFAWRRGLFLATMFTIAHTLTLFGAMTGVIPVLPSIVEPLIAISIAILAIWHGFFPQIKSGLWIVIFIFGLIHGLGFAGSLAGIEIQTSTFLASLISFNIGVEFAQIAILLVFVPVYWLGYRKFPMIQKILAVAFALVGIFWFLERVLG